MASATSASPLPPAFSMPSMVATMSDSVRAVPTTVGAGLGEDPRDPLSDALSGAGDDRDLSVQIELLQRHAGPLRPRDVPSSKRTYTD